MSNNLPAVGIRAEPVSELMQRTGRYKFGKFAPDGLKGLSAFGVPGSKRHRIKMPHHSMRHFFFMRKRILPCYDKTSDFFLIFSILSYRIGISWTCLLFYPGHTLDTNHHILLLYISRWFLIAPIISSLMTAGTTNSDLLPTCTFSPSPNRPR